MASDIIQLSGAEFLARGRIRKIYQHPSDPDKIVKVVDPRQPSSKAFKRWLQRHAPETKYRHLIRESNACFRTAVLAFEQGTCSPLAAQFGVVQTDIGFATICERVRLPDESLGRTLTNIFKAGELDQYVPTLNAFAAQIFRLRVCVNDLHGGNIVLGERDGAPSFLMVDGIGDHGIIPLRSVLSAINEHHLQKRFAGLAGQLGLIWQRSTKSFLPPS